MIAQYRALKAAHPGALLFFRMGDFYELFFEDAVAAAPALEIALTKRGRHGGEDIPMCGVPAHNAEPYLHRLIRHGFRVAVCEQLEDPAEARRRGGKPLVRRDVVRVVTPGTLTEDGLLESPPQQLPPRREPPGARRGPRPRLGRRLHRRVRHPALHPGPPGRRPGPPRARRGPGA
jgi:DNA mismatch repair ATPase MutS